MSPLQLVLVIVLIFACAGTFPAWPHARDWGNAPIGLSTMLLIIVIAWIATGNR